MSLKLSERIKFNVGGKIFETTIATIFTFTDHILVKLVHERQIPIDFEKRGPQIDECIFIDRDPKLFSYILNYLRKENLNVPENEIFLKDLLDEALFYNIQNLVNLIESKLLRIQSKKHQTQIQKSIDRCSRKTDFVPSDLTPLRKFPSCSMGLLSTTGPGVPSALSSSCSAEDERAPDYFQTASNFDRCDTPRSPPSALPTEPGSLPLIRASAEEQELECRRRSLVNDVPTPPSSCFLLEGIDLGPRVLDSVKWRAALLRRFTALRQKNLIPKPPPPQDAAEESQENSRPPTTPFLKPSIVDINDHQIILHTQSLENLNDACSSARSYRQGSLEAVEDVSVGEHDGNESSEPEREFNEQLPFRRSAFTDSIFVHEIRNETPAFADSVEVEPVLGISPSLTSASSKPIPGPPRDQNSNANSTTNSSSSSTGSGVSSDISSDTTIGVSSHSSGSIHSMGQQIALTSGTTGDLPLSEKDGAPETPPPLLATEKSSPEKSFSKRLRLLGRHSKKQQLTTVEAPSRSPRTNPSPRRSLSILQRLHSKMSNQRRHKEVLDKLSKAVPIAVPEQEEGQTPMRKETRASLDRVGSSALPDPLNQPQSGEVWEAGDTSTGNQAKEGEGAEGVKREAGSTFDDPKLENSSVELPPPSESPSHSPFKVSSKLKFRFFKKKGSAGGGAGALSLMTPMLSQSTSAATALSPQVSALREESNLTSPIASPKTNKPTRSSFFVVARRGGRVLAVSGSGEDSFKKEQTTDLSSESLEKERATPDPSVLENTNENKINLPSSSLKSRRKDGPSLVNDVKGQGDEEDGYSLSPSGTLTKLFTIDFDIQGSRYMGGSGVEPEVKKKKSIWKKLFKTSSQIETIPHKKYPVRSSTAYLSNEEDLKLPPFPIIEKKKSFWNFLKPSKKDTKSTTSPPDNLDPQLTPTTPKPTLIIPSASVSADASTSASTNASTNVTLNANAIPVANNSETFSTPQIVNTESRSTRRSFLFSLWHKKGV